MQILRCSAAFCKTRKGQNSKRKRHLMPEVEEKITTVEKIISIKIKWYKMHKKSDNKAEKCTK
jgi:hypothetical protein